MLWRGAGCAVVLGLALAAPASAPASQFPTTTLAISQVYGGGGTANATYSRDYIELHNNSRSAVDLTGMSVQYASSTGNTWTVTSFSSGSVPAGGYFLVAGSSGATGAPLPTPDVTNNGLSMGSNAGKVALLASSTPLTCGNLGNSCSGEAQIIDFIGYGGSSGTVYDYEGAPAPALGATPPLAALRGDAGCLDTQDNSSDFSAVPPNPRNSSNAVVCNKPPVITTTPDGSMTVAEGQTLTFTTNATDPDGDTIVSRGLSGVTGADAPVLTTNGPNSATVTWTPDFSRAAGSPYTLTLSAGDGLATGTKQVSVTVTDVPQTTSGSGGSSGGGSGGGTTSTTADTTQSSTTTTTGTTTQETQTQPGCVVPKLKGLSLKKAKAKLVKARCKLGKVTKKQAKPAARGKVLAQTPKPGTKKPAGSKVALTLGR